MVDVLPGNFGQLSFFIDERIKIIDVRHFNNWTNITRLIIEKVGVDGFCVLIYRPLMACKKREFPLKMETLNRFQG